MVPVMIDALRGSRNRISCDQSLDLDDIPRIGVIKQIKRRLESEDNMAARAKKKEEEGAGTSETYRVAYMFESNVWGQAMFLEEPKNNMVLITASDFDSGQTVRIGLDIDTFSKLCQTGQTFAAMKSLQGDGGEANESGQ